MPDNLTPFWIDPDQHDRYGNYVRLEPFEPWTDDDQAVELAVHAWRRGTGPVMSPPYIHEHPRILSVQVERSGWDGKLAARVDLLTSRPAELGEPPAPDGGRWRSWPSEHSFMADRTLYFEPEGEELAKGAYLLAQVSLRFTVPSGDLPQPPYTDLPNVRTLDASALAETCKRAVEVLVRELNAAVRPVLARIEGES